MFRLVAVLAIATIVVAKPPAIIVNGDMVQVLVVHDIDESKSLYPTAKFTELEMNDNVRVSKRYTLGERVDGDRLVAQGSDKKKWPSPQIVQVALHYPTSGQGAVITYVQIDVSQSTNNGRAYVVSGGIGQTNIFIIIEAYGTTYFEYAAAIYGH